MSKKRKTLEEKKLVLRKRMAELLELPKDIALNIPKLTIVGNNDLLIENFKGIVEFNTEVIRINTASGILKVVGSRLGIKGITADELIINGEIVSLEFR